MKKKTQKESELLTIDAVEDAMTEYFSILASALSTQGLEPQINYLHKQGLTDKKILQLAAMHLMGKFAKLNKDLE